MSAWKANMRNLALLEEHLRRDRLPAPSANRGSCVLLGLGLVLLTAGAIALAVLLFRFFDGMLRGGLIG